MGGEQMVGRRRWADGRQAWVQSEYVSYLKSATIRYLVSLVGSLASSFWGGERERRERRGRGGHKRRC